MLKHVRIKIKKHVNPIFTNKIFRTYIKNYIIESPEATCKSCFENYCYISRAEKLIYYHNYES